jgi:DNA invertase Pin-like site-specific DNA recombinase
MKYGYTRVSTGDQNSASQLTALKKAGRKTVFKGQGLPAATVKRLRRCSPSICSLSGGSTAWKAPCANR